MCRHLAGLFKAAAEDLLCGFVIVDQIAARAHQENRKRKKAGEGIADVLADMKQLSVDIKAKDERIAQLEALLREDRDR